MDWDRIEGSWKQFRGKAKSQWGALTDDELTRIAGKQDQLIGKLQERYGYSRDRARGEVERWALGTGRPKPLSWFVQQRYGYAKDQNPKRGRRLVQAVALSDWPPGWHHPGGTKHRCQGLKFARAD